MKLSVSVLRGVFLLGARLCATDGQCRRYVDYARRRCKLGGCKKGARPPSWLSASYRRACLILSKMLPRLMARCNQVESLKGAKGDVLDVRIVSATGYYRGGGFVPRAGRQNLCWRPKAH